MAAKEKAGRCPKCGDANTELVLGRSNGEHVARCKCRSCGFEDMRVRGDDPVIVAEVAKEHFSTVYAHAGGGLPSVEQLVHDLSQALAIICRRVPSCETCPLHAVDDREKPRDSTDEGWLYANSKLGLECRHQNADVMRSDLMSKYPALPLGD